MPLVHR
jgi:type VI secretion system protein ImpC